MQTHLCFHSSIFLSFPHLLVFSHMMPEPQISPSHMHTHLSPPALPPPPIMVPFFLSAAGWPILQEAIPCPPRPNETLFWELPEYIPLMPISSFCLFIFPTFQWLRDNSLMKSSDRTTDLSLPQIHFLPFTFFKVHL